MYCWWGPGAGCRVVPVSWAGEELPGAGLLGQRGVCPQAVDKGIHFLLKGWTASPWDPLESRAVGRPLLTPSPTHGSLCGQEGAGLACWGRGPSWLC